MCYTSTSHWLSETRVDSVGIQTDEPNLVEIDTAGIHCLHYRVHSTDIVAHAYTVVLRSAPPVPRDRLGIAEGQVFR